MAPILELLNKEGFLKNLFESLPCGVLVVDRDRRIQAVNNVLERTLGISGAEAVGKRGGEALRCIYAAHGASRCGFAEACKTCRVRNTALEALAGNQVHRNKANVQLLVDGKASDLQLLVSAAPFDHEGERLAIIILEDITELNILRRRLKAEQSFAGIIGQDPTMNELFETIRQVTEVNVPILIQGESGTGKELVAAAIHNQGPRANKLFVPVNCGAMPEGLLESELFGHVKGSFTGAVRDKKGRFELAQGGTLFLDEITELPKASQSKLLRVLQEGKIERVGGEETIPVDVRLITATNRELKREVERGNFREDLYYRIKVVPIHLPPLRDRHNDIPLLVDYFLEKSLEEGQRPSDLSKEALVIMMDYPWPGNVRELQSAIRFALIKSGGQIIQPEHLPLELKDWNNRRPSRGPSRKLDLKGVSAALTRTGGNKAKAARLLGVSRATLYRFLTDFQAVS